MRVPRALLVALIAALLTAGTVAVAAPSSAGGPTSVLLVDSATGRATALYATDPRYQRLSDLLDALAAPPASIEPAPRTGAGNSLVDSGAINVTWLLHDVQVWRVDRIYVDGDAAVIASQSDLSGGSILEAEPVWHHPSNPKDLARLLNDLGLGAPGAPPSAVPSPAISTAPAAVEQAQNAATTASGTTGPFWGVAGAVVGAGLVLGLGRFRNTGRRNRDDDSDADVPSSGDVIRY